MSVELCPMGREGMKRGRQCVEDLRKQHGHEVHGYEEPYFQILSLLQDAPTSPR